MKGYRIIVIAEGKELQWSKIVLLQNQVQFYQAKNFQDALFHLTTFSYHLIVIELNQQYGVICQLVETIRKLVNTPMIVLLPYSKDRGQVIYAGADVVLQKPYSSEEINLQAYALVRRYTEWKFEEKEEILVVEEMKINAFQRSVFWKKNKIPVVKKEFDFLYLLATTPGRVYTYSQIYHIVWQEYPHGDITNIIYCMVHRLKRKLKEVDVNAADIICSVKEVGYCLKVYKES